MVVGSRRPLDDEDQLPPGLIPDARGATNAARWRVRFKFDDGGGWTGLRLERALVVLLPRRDRTTEVGRGGRGAPGHAAADSAMSVDGGAGVHMGAAAKAGASHDNLPPRPANWDQMTRVNRGHWTQRQNKKRKKQ